jgi:hypothetical protein
MLSLSFNIRNHNTGIDMNNGKKPDAPAVRMGLSSMIYQTWEESTAMVKFILDKL